MAKRFQTGPMRQTGRLDRHPLNLIGTKKAAIPNGTPLGGFKYSNLCVGRIFDP
jgi:hypothetical protein